MLYVLDDPGLGIGKRERQAGNLFIHPFLGGGKDTGGICLPVLFLLENSQLQEENFIKSQSCPGFPQLSLGCRKMCLL